jgi:hypothetical protein
VQRPQSGKSETRADSRFAPVWTDMWVFRLEGRLNRLSQTGLPSQRVLLSLSPSRSKTRHWTDGERLGARLRSR